MKNILLERKAQIETNIQDSKHNITLLKSQEVNDDFDYAEVSSDSYTEGLIINQQLSELSEIDAALNRIKNGTYGICEMCDDVISLGRLKAKPFAKYCIVCRELVEKNNKELAKAK
ncbi:MAG: RNA polymerase-binding protein DksA [Arcobacter butzleri]|nr:RNA polymerase-binding protein DksA [Arcobacteraceae bacterium]NLO16930.1 RNA polymerase-binding protein DksA [Aliarcobacter butzleri]